MNTKKRFWVMILGSVTVVSLGLTGLTGCSQIVSKKQATGVAAANSVTKRSNAVDSKNDLNTIEKYKYLLGQPEEKVIGQLSENPVTIDEGGLEFKKAGIRLWFKDFGKGPVVSQIFTQKKDIDFNGARIGDNISSFRKALGNPVSDKNGEAYFKYKEVVLSFNYDLKTGDTICAYFLTKDNNEENTSANPQVKVPVDMKIVENEQKSVDAGHSPWQLDPAFVAQVFVSLKISPEGIKGEYPIKYEALKLTQNTGKEAIVQVDTANTPISRVYLKRLVKQDSTGIWTVVGYEPAAKE